MRPLFCVVDPLARYPVRTTATEPSESTPGGTIIDDDFFGLLKSVALQPFHYLVFFTTAVIFVVGLKVMGLIRPFDWSSNLNCIIFAAVYLGICAASWTAGALATRFERKKWGLPGTIVANVLALALAALGAVVLLGL